MQISKLILITIFNIGWINSEETVKSVKKSVESEDEVFNEEFDGNIADISPEEFIKAMTEYLKDIEGETLTTE